MTIPLEGRSKMLFQLLLIVFSFYCWSPVDSRVIQKRAAFYLANETMCIVDGDIYRNGDPVPTDDECERCTCRPPGFSCVLRDCDTKPGCKAVRKVGECCPEYVCGCVHNSRLYEDGELIRDLQNNCYTCRCHGSSISCTFADCLFRGDCPPEYLPGECCPNYDHCPPMSSTTTTTTTSPIIQQEEEFFNLTTQHLQKFTSEGTTITIFDISASESLVTTPSYAPQETLFTVKFTLSGEKISSLHELDATELTTVLPRQTVSYKDTTRYIVTPPGAELTSLKLDLGVGGFEATTQASSTSDETYSTVFTSKSSTVAVSEPTKQSSETSKMDEFPHTSDAEDNTDSESGINTVQDLETSSFSGDFTFTTHTLKEETQFGLTTSEQGSEETVHKQEIGSENAFSTSSHSVEDSNVDVSQVFPVTHEDITTSTEHLLVTESNEGIPSNIHIDSELSTTVQDRDANNDATSSVRIDGHVTPETSIQDQDDLQASSHEIHAVTATVKATWMDFDSLHSNFNMTDSENQTVSQLDMSTESPDISMQTSHTIETETDFNSESTVTPTERTTEQTVHEIKLSTTYLNERSNQTVETTPSYTILDIINATDETYENSASENLTNSSHKETESGYDSQTIKTFSENNEPTENFNSQNSFSTENIADSDLDESVKSDEISNTSSHSTETLEHLFPGVTTEKSSITNHFTTNQHTFDDDLDELDTSDVDDVLSPQQTGSSIIVASTITDELSSKDHGFSTISEENELISKYATTVDTTSESIHTISEMLSEKNVISHDADLTDDEKIDAEVESEELEPQETQDSHNGNGSTGIEYNSAEYETAESASSITTSEIESINSYHETSDESDLTSLDLSDTNMSSTGINLIANSPDENIIDPNLNSSNGNNESLEVHATSFTIPSEETTLEELDKESSLTGYVKHSHTESENKQPSTTHETRQTVSDFTTKYNDAGHYDSHDLNEHLVPGADGENLNVTNYESGLVDDFQTSEITTSSQSNTFVNNEIIHSNDSSSLNIDTDKTTVESLASTFHYEDEHSEFQDKETFQNYDRNATDNLNTSSESSITTVGQLLVTTVVGKDGLYDSSQKGSDSTKIFITDPSFDPSSNETNSETDDIDTLHVKHDAKASGIIGVTSTPSSFAAITPLKTSTEKSASFQDSDIPIEIAAFEPPMANILKQQMLFNQQIAQKENISLFDEQKEDQTNLTNNSSDASDIVRLSLTLAEENDESAISNDSKNDIFVLNHQYTISDSEVNDLDELDSHNSEKYDSVNEDHSHLVDTTFIDQSTTINYSETPTSTVDKPIHISDENEESIFFIPSDEKPEPEKNINETADSIKSIPEIVESPILHSDAIESYAASENSIDIQTVKDVLELSTTNNLQEYENEISAVEISENIQKTSVIDHENNKETNSEVDLSVATTTGKIDVINDSNNVTEETQQTDILPAEDQELHIITRFDLNEDHSSDELPENYKEPDIDFSYHDAESEGNLEEDRGAPQGISVNNLDPEMITALHNISALLMSNTTGSLNESLEIRDEHEHSSSTSAYVENDDHSTIKINVLFGQNSPDTHQEHEVLEEESTLSNKRDSNTTTQLTLQENLYLSKDTETTNVDKVPTEIQENILFAEELSETKSSNISQTETNRNAADDIKFSVSSTILDDLAKTNTEKNSFENIKTSEIINSDELTSPDSSSLYTDKNSVPTISSTLSDTEEIDTTLTTAKYIGDLFSKITTFLTTSENKDHISTHSEAEIANTEENSQNVNEHDYSTEAGTDSETKLVLHNRIEIETNTDTDTSKTETIQNERATFSPLDLSEILDENLKFDTEIIEHHVESFSKTESPTYIDKTDQDSTIALDSETVEESLSSSDNNRNHLKIDENHNTILTSEHVFETSNQQLSVENSDTKLTTSSDIGTEISFEKEGFSPLDLFHAQENEESVQSSPHINETSLNRSESPEIHGPEKRGEIFEPSFPAIFPVKSAESEENEESVQSSHTNETSLNPSESPEIRGPEKGGEVFEPSFPAIFPVKSEESEENEESVQSSHTNETSLNPSESPEIHGPEKGGEVFEPSFPAIFPVKSAESEAIANSYDNFSDKDEPNTVTTEIFEHEKGGDVFEPSFSEVSSLNGEHIENHDNVSDSVTTSSVSEKLEEIREITTSINDTTLTKFSGSTPESFISLDKIQHNSEFVPPLPILLKGLGKTDGGNVEESNSKTERSDIDLESSLDISQENDFATSKSDEARSFYHPFPLSDVISEVFKAPGYDSEIHLSPWRRINPLTKSQILRLKRSEPKSYEEGSRKNEEFSQFYPLSNNPDRSSNGDSSSISKKNVLLVEGYGFKPSGFLPVTSSLIIVHSDEDTKDNEAGNDFKQKTATTKPEASILRKEFQNEISTESPLETINSSTDHTGQ